MRKLRHRQVKEFARGNEDSVEQRLEYPSVTPETQDSKMPPAAASWTVGSTTDVAATAFSVLWEGKGSAVRLHAPSQLGSGE